MTDVTYRESLVAFYTHPVTWIAHLAGFAAWATLGYLAGVIVTTVIGGYAAHRTVGELLKSEYPGED